MFADTPYPYFFLLGVIECLGRVQNLHVIHTRGKVDDKDMLLFRKVCHYLYPH